MPRQGEWNAALIREGGPTSREYAPDAQENSFFDPPKRLLQKMLLFVVGLGRLLVGVLGCLRGDLCGRLPG